MTQSFLFELHWTTIPISRLWLLPAAVILTLGMSDGQALAQVTFAGSGELNAKITPAGEASTTDVMPYVFSDVQSYENMLDLSADDVSAFGQFFTSTLRTLSEFGVVTRLFNIDGELFSRARDPRMGLRLRGSH